MERNTTAKYLKYLITNEIYSLQKVEMNKFEKVCKQNMGIFWMIFNEVKYS